MTKHGEWKDENNILHSGKIICNKNNINIIDCKTCGFKHAIPLPSVDELKTFYKEKYYEQDRKIDYAEKQKEQEKWWGRIYAERCKKFNNILGEKGRILDIGCGPGFFMKKAQDLGWQATGIEPSQKASNYAINNLGLDLYNINIESIDECDFDLKSFDVIYSHGVLEHMRKPNLFFSNAKKYLKDGGLLFYSVANDFSPLQNIMLENSSVDPWWVVPPEHLNYFDKLSAENIAINNGFNIVDATATFPIDMFLLMGENYISDKSLGPSAYKKIVNLEDAILKSSHKDLLTDMYKNFYNLGIGRQLEITARNNL
tara:strand:- start:95 stop:1036 length:942 start_codon:yes stop_codon:yes gene_type:complete